MDFTTFDRRLREADATRNLGYLSQTLVDMMRADPAVTFAVAEKRLREIGSNTYLVALPTRFAAAQLEVRHPVTGDAADHFLWVCMHGIDEAIQTYRTHGIPSTNANLEALSTCGVLVPGDQLSG